MTRFPVFFFFFFFAVTVSRSVANFVSGQTDGSCQTATALRVRKSPRPRNYSRVVERGRLTNASHLLAYAEVMLRRLTNDECLRRRDAFEANPLVCFRDVRHVYVGAA